MSDDLKSLGQVACHAHGQDWDYEMESERADWDGVAAAVIAAYEERTGVLAALNALMDASECAEEIGYVDGKGYMDINEIKRRAHEAIAKAEALKGGRA